MSQHFVAHERGIKNCFLGPTNKQIFFLREKKENNYWSRPIGAKFASNKKFHSTDRS